MEEAVATEGATDGPYAAAPVPSDPMQATPVNDGPGALTLALDERGNINASLSDPDGISTAPQIQWLRSGVPVPGATGQTYTVQYADSQSAISARADYLDGDGFRESVVSQPVQIGVIIP